MTRTLVLLALSFGASVSIAGGSAAAAPTQLESQPRIVASPVAPDRVSGHKFRPANVTPASSDDGEMFGTSKTVPGKAVNAKFNVTAFAAALEADFKDKVAGYAMQVKKDGNVVVTQQSGYARKPSDGDKAFSVNSRMHVASLSKLVTAIATVKALTDANLSFDARIGPYLPAYWRLGDNVANLTFRRLLTHKSGFSVPSVNGDCGCAGDYLTMKSVAGSAVSAATPEQGHYENVNFSILRVILPILTGAVPRGNVYANVAVPASAIQNDVIWDILTTQAFVAYVQAKVFTPSGVSGVSAVPDGQGALAYESVNDTSGVDTGDLSSQLGGAGFRISVAEALKVMDAFRRRGTIVSPSKAQEAIEAGLGLDLEQSTTAGKMWFKNGGWSHNGHVEQTIGYFLPDGVELVVFLNSKSAKGSITKVVNDDVLASILPPPQPQAQPSNQRLAK